MSAKRSKSPSPLDMTLPLYQGELSAKTLPSGWKMVKLEEVCEINPKISRVINAEEKVSFIPMKSVGEANGAVDLSEIRNFQAIRKGYTPMQTGDVIFAKITPCMENGKIAVLPALENGIGFGSTEFFVLRCKSEQLDNRYLFHLLVQKKFRQEAARHMTGAVGQRRVPKTFLADYEFPLPSLDEQRRIVEKIEKVFSACDRLEARLAHALEQSAVLRQSILSRAFSGNL